MLTFKYYLSKILKRLYQARILIPHILGARIDGVGSELGYGASSPVNCHWTPFLLCAGVQQPIYRASKGLVTIGHQIDNEPARA